MLQRTTYANGQRWAQGRDVSDPNAAMAKQHALRKGRDSGRDTAEAQNKKRLMNQRIANRPQNRNNTKPNNKGVCVN